MLYWLAIRRLPEGYLFDREILDHIVGGNHRLVSLAADLLDYRAENGGHSHPVELSETLRRAVARFATSEPDQGARDSSLAPKLDEDPE